MEIHHYYHYNTLLYSFLIILIIIIDQIQLSTTMQSKLDQKFAMEPQDQVAAIGSRVILPCRIINRQGIIQWTKDDFGLGVRRRLSGFDRYSMIGSDEEGDYSLQIYPVVLDDDAKFQCQASPGQHGQPGIRSKYGILTVLVPPETPRILQGSHMITTEDRQIELECISTNGKPAAEITWIDGFGNVLTTGIEYVKEPSLPDMRTFTARSILKLKTHKIYHNKTIICQAQNSVEKTFRTATILLDVKYAPKVTVLMDTEHMSYGKIIEFTNINFYCESDANPHDINYKWYLNDELMGGEHMNEVIIINVTRDLQNAIVKCESQNSVGKSSDSEILDIAYKPTFVLRPEDTEADYGENIQLYCKVDANPPAEIVWVFDPIDRLNFHPRVVGTKNCLELIASNETAGRYFCKANSLGSLEIIAEASVNLKGPPNILSETKQYPQTTTGKYQIECFAVSIPKANHITWSFNGKSINFENEINFSEISIYYPNGIKSILTIENDNPISYFGHYNCIIINSYGSDMIEIIFNEKSNLSIIIVTAGITIFTIILVALITILIVYRKIRKKKLPPADLIPIDDNKSINSKSITNQNQFKKYQKKYDGNKNPTIIEHDYQESNSGSYSTTTTLSINKNDCLVGKASIINLPPILNINSNRFSQNYIDANKPILNGGIMGITDSVGPISINSNQSINGGTSYVDYARDYYSPIIQHQHIMQIPKETPTYV